MSIRQENKHPTTWAINAFIVLSVIIYILMAEQLNKTIHDTMKEESVLKMVFYVTRYHVGSKGLHRIDTHGSLSTIYGIPWTDNLIITPNNIIARALFISDCVNTSLCFVKNTSIKKQTANQFQLNIYYVSCLICTLFTTLHLKAPTKKFEDYVRNMSKCFSTYLFYNL